MGAGNALAPTFGTVTAFTCKNNGRFVSDPSKYRVEATCASKATTPYYEWQFNGDPSDTECKEGGRIKMAKCKGNHAWAAPYDSI